MVELHTYFNTVELQRLHREGELPRSDILSTVTRYMAIEGSILLLIRDKASWDVKAVLVDTPDPKDHSGRNILYVYTDIERIEVTLLQQHLRDNHFRIGMVHLPAHTQLAGDWATWRVMRHKKQAIGELKQFKFISLGKVERDLARIAANGETARLEIHLSRPVRNGVKDICRQLNKYGFVTRKYIYHVTPE